MQRNHGIMFYISALLAIAGGVAYQIIVKRVPVTINPIVSVMGLYVSVFLFSLILLPFFPAEGGLQSHFRQLSWIQVALAVTVILIELGFLLMYRYGWLLSSGNLVTGVFINIILLIVGVAILGEKVSLVNVIGIILSIIGVALISLHP